MAFPTGWSKKQKITIDNTKVSGSSNLTDYPIMIDEDIFDAEIFSNTKSDGGDIRASSDAAGSTELAVDVVRWDTSGQTGVIFVKIPTLSYNSDTDIYIWYDNSGASMPADSDTYGRNNVWVSTYKGVWHLQEAVNTTAGGYEDSTSNGQDMTGVSMALTEVNGKFGKAQDFDGTADYIKRTSANAISTATTNMTVSAWINTDVDSSAYTILGTSDEALDTKYWRLLTFDQSSTHRFQVNAENAGGARRIAGTTTEISTGTWYYVHLTSDGTNYKLYVNGTLQSETAAVGSDDGHLFGDIPDRDNFTVGTYERTSTTQFFNGKIQEVRVEETERDVDWITTEYNNMNSASTFASSEVIGSFVPRMTIIV